jgi:Transposase domain (DUF772)
MGRPPAERKAIARCFVTKAVSKYQYTRSLIHELQARPNLRRICGFVCQRQIPSESTFSQVFAEFAADNLGTVVNDALVKEYWSEELVGHISRDSTAIRGREKATKKVKQPEERRLEKQPRLTAEDAIAVLPKVCDRGTKKNSQGYKESWNGFKLHVDVNDAGVPLSAVLASASVHERSNGCSL